VDKVVWIALFARPDSEGAFAGQARLMQTLRPHIPAVPEIFAYSDQEEELGGRYILMEGICGEKAEAEYFIFGIPDQYWHHVLEQLGCVMALGMSVTWDTFQVNGETYKSDTAFWIDSARQRIRGAINEISFDQVVVNKKYSDFLAEAQPRLKLLFAELLYLNCDFLIPSRRPSNMLMKFPAHLPRLSMENIIFDDDYTIKGLIGFPRTESVSSWEYFQFPYRLEESFDHTSMARTIAWMRQCFEGAWARKLDSLNLSYEGLASRVQWCQKDKVQLLYRFRISPNPEEFVDKLFSHFYNFHSSITVGSLWMAFLYTIFSALDSRNQNVLHGKPDVYIAMFTEILTLPTDEMLKREEIGFRLAHGFLNGQDIE
jgi:hypothetical protein